MPLANNLPQRLTSFVGREREQAEVVRLLASARLVLLTGIGGVGKTRLALQVASGLLDRYSGRVWFVDLAPLSEPGLAPQAVASALDVREEAGHDILSTIESYLQPRPSLLLLDNCEHLVEACTALADRLLRSCPHLTILATSRQGLGVEGEVVWRVPALTLPGPEEDCSITQLAQCEAMQLFVQRVRLCRPDWILTDANASVVAQLCRQLDGLPLAIELAAARVKVLSVEQIVERLDERFRLLAGVSGGTLPRHQTLTAMMDWSYDLLSEGERALLRGLAVFAGGFDLPAVGPICGLEWDEWETLEGLSPLVDKSLVAAEEEGGEVRYGLSATIRAYAWEKLRGAGELPTVGGRHRDWYLGFAELSEVQLIGREQGVWLQRLEREHDNLRAALSWSEAQGEAVEGLRIAGALVWFWYFRGYLSEGRGWLELLLALDDPSSLTTVRAKALSAAGVLAYLQSDDGAARSLLEDGLRIWSALEDKRGAAFALTVLGRVLVRVGDPSARLLGERSVALFREVGDIWGIALSLDLLGEAARREGDGERATLLHGESLALYRRLGDRWGIALEHSSAGQLALRQGDYASARSHLEKALLLQRQVGDRWTVAWTLFALGDVVGREGDSERAGVLYSESLQLFRELGDKSGTAGALHKLGRAACAERNLERAQSLLDESLALYRELGDAGAVALQLAWLANLQRQGGNYREAETLLWEGLAGARNLEDERATVEDVLQFALLAAAQGELESASLLLGAVWAAGELLAIHDLSASPLEEFQRLLSGLEDGAVGAKLRQAWERGRRMPLEDAVAYILEGASFAVKSVEAEELHPVATGSKQRAATYPSEITKREAEVLSLLAEGLTDAQIAERLVLSARTVQAHVRSIYSKLGVTTRSAATRYAMEHGID